MQDLGANAIRVYHVDPTADHKGCMDAFADVGIYLFVDLDDFPTQIQPVRSLKTTYIFCHLIRRLTDNAFVESESTGCLLRRPGRVPEIRQHGWRFRWERGSYNR